MFKIDRSCHVELKAICQRWVNDLLFCFHFSKFEHGHFETPVSAPEWSYIRPLRLRSNLFLSFSNLMIFRFNTTFFQQRDTGARNLTRWLLGCHNVKMPRFVLFDELSLLWRWFLSGIVYIIPISVLNNFVKLSISRCNSIKGYFFEPTVRKSAIWRPTFWLALFVIIFSRYWDTEIKILI